MPHVLHWFRRDFRVRDNTALLAAARIAAAAGTVTGVFIIDTRWWPASAGQLGAFQAKFWLQSLAHLRDTLAPLGIPLVVRTSADPVAELLRIARPAGEKGGRAAGDSATTITFNKEYEPAQIAMDLRLEHEAAALDITVHACKDSAYFEEHDLLTGSGQPYAVFTPYKNAYLKKLALTPPIPAGLPAKLPRRTGISTGELPTLAQLGFPDLPLDLIAGEAAGLDQLTSFCNRSLPTYAATRDIPALSLPAQHPGTSRLSAHLSAGTLSLRQVLAAVLSTMISKSRKKESADTFLAELIWRDFYRMILFHHPHTVSHAFQQKYDGLPWSNDPVHVDAWCTARTGFPIVDAAMRQLLSTGFMHNRLRMIAAAFLTKDLDCHWVLGERFFRRTLIDYDQAANVGGWQWSASTGTDAAPYFRIMNPTLQSQRFDPEGIFIRHYLPELRHVPTAFIHAPHEMPPALQKQSQCIIGGDYPAPIIDHSQAKRRAIAKFQLRKSAAEP